MTGGPWWWGGCSANQPLAGQSLAWKSHARLHAVTTAVVASTMSRRRGPEIDLVLTALSSPVTVTRIIENQRVRRPDRERRGQVPIQIVDASGSILHFRLQGTLRKADYDRMAAAARDAIARHGSIRVLVALDAFAGWEQHDGWGDLSFMMDEGERIDRIAIVGEEQWRDDSLAFTASGLRPTVIEYFLPSDLAEARRWLSTALKS